jgi:hypothetical protein
LGAPELKPPELTGADGAVAAGAALGADGLLALNPPDDDGLELGRENPPDEDGDDDRLLELLDDELLLELPAHDEPANAIEMATMLIALVNFMALPFAVMRQIAESRKLAFKLQLDRASRAVALLADDDLGLAVNQ